ncbi:MAG: prepilin peptidase [Ruminococcaceae bacterium]|nr:prepilin peptidase [Oscillospiraceae bacterium]
MYDSSNNPTIIIDRSGPGMAEANSKIGNLKSDISELEIKIEALYRVMVDQGIDPKIFEAKIEEIVNERAGKIRIPEDSKNCPKCGRVVRKNGNAPQLGKCMYCGTNVPFYPSFLTKEELANSEQPGQ